MTGDIVGVLLAAGMGRRFGADKRWHPLADGTPMAIEAARRLRAVCPISVAVIRPGDDALQRVLLEAGLQVTLCTDAALGMGHSLAAGVRATPDAAGWLVALADMPAIAPASYRVVRDALRHGAPLARSTHGGAAGHPVGFAAQFLDELIALQGDRGGKAILDAHRDLLTCCEVSDPGVLIDFDRPPAIGADGES